LDQAAPGPALPAPGSASEGPPGAPAPSQSSKTASSCGLIRRASWCREPTIFLDWLSNGVLEINPDEAVAAFNHVEARFGRPGWLELISHAFSQTG